MRGGLSYEMTSSCFQGGIQQLGRYQQNMLIEPSSPTEAWQYHQVLPKTEPIEPQTEITTHNNNYEEEEEETKHDSGLLSGNSDLSPYSNSIIYPHHPLTPPNLYPQHPLTPPNSENEEILKRLQNNILSQNSSPGINSSPINRRISSNDDYLKKYHSGTSNNDLLKNEFLKQSTENDDFLKRLHKKNDFLEQTSENDDLLKKYPNRVSSPNSNNDFSKRLHKRNDFLEQTSENDDLLKKYPNRVNSPNSNDFLKRLHKKNDFLEQTSENDDFLKRLHNTVEKSISSPKISENSDKSDDEYDEQGIKIPRVNSHGKIKTFKCKQCDFIAITKLIFWEHTKTHIKADKLLTCPKCPFVTEYKHHLEYHLRNHFGSKPFKCTQCNYSCVNKSMLNSHLKSHSNIYQYRCADCAYATKYCHSLKLHLRKYAHKPAMVLNPDGTPNPLPIIDVYGTRRGPKIKQSLSDKKDDFDGGDDEKKNELSINTTNPLMQFPFFTGFPFFAPNPFILHNLSKIVEQDYRKSASEDLDCVLDLSKSDDKNKNIKKSNDDIDDNNIESSDDNDDDDDERMEMLQNVEVVENLNSNDGGGGDDDDGNKDLSLVDGSGGGGGYNCQFCQINFGEPVLYTMHMGYHGYKSPFTCNMCGEECGDKVEFFLHIARTKHS